MKIRISSLMIGVLLLSGIVLANGEMPKEMLKDLELSPAQAKQMEAIHQKQKSNPKENMGNIKKLHDQLDEELCKDQPDNEKAQKIIAEIKITQAKLIDAHYASLLEVRTILTKEQFKKMVDKKKELGERMRRHARDKKGPPPPPMM